MTTINLLLTNGDTEKANYDFNKEEFTSPAPESCCLTCGRESEKLNLLSVSLHSLTNWLEDRLHFANDNEYVLLCNDCEEEAII